MQRFIKIDGKVRTDITYPAGFMGECRRTAAARMQSKGLFGSSRSVVVAGCGIERFRQVFVGRRSSDDYLVLISNELKLHDRFL